MDIANRAVLRASKKRSRRERFQRLLIERLEARRLLAAEFGLNQEPSAAADIAWQVSEASQEPEAALAVLPTVSISSVTSLKKEGSSGPTVFTFQVTRGTDTSGSTTVGFSVSGSGANPAEAADFEGGVFPADTVTFDVGDVTKTFDVTVQGDSLAERDEQFTVTLSGDAGDAVEIEQATASSLIRNDDNVDAGDLPSHFRTLIDDNGPTHLAIGPTLGTERDVDSDGQPNAFADGDDTNGAPDDEDGVTFAPVKIGALAAEVRVFVSADTKLDAWIDFNGDGTLNGANEQIFRSQDVVAGNNILTFAVPADARAGSTYARFRVSTAGGLSIGGDAADGEVEDHVVTILGASGNGTVTTSSRTTESFQTRGVKLGDLDGDGDLDAFTVNFEQVNQVFLNNGSAGFTFNDQSSLTPFPVTGASTSVALGDVDGDGDLDAFVGNTGEANRVWINNGAGNFSDSLQALGSEDTTGVALGDLDGDGDLDAVSSNLNQGDRVYLNDGLGNFLETAQSLGTFDSYAVGFGRH